MAIVQKTIDLELGTSVTFDFEDTVFWYMINGRNDAMELREIGDSGNQGRNFFYEIPGLQWRTNSQNISNGPGEEVVGDREPGARRQLFSGNVVGSDPLVVANKLDEYAAFLDKNASPYYLFNNQLNRFAKVERIRISPKVRMQGMEHLLTDLEIEFLIEKVYFESPDFKSEIYNDSSFLVTGASTSRDYVVHNECIHPVKVISDFQAVGFPVDFKVTNLQNGRGFRIVDNSFVNGASLIVDGRTNSFRLTPANETNSIESSRSLYQGGHLLLDPGYNIIRVECTSDFAVPDFYWRNRFAS